MNPGTGTTYAIAWLRSTSTSPCPTLGCVSGSGYGDVLEIAFHTSTAIVRSLAMDKQKLLESKIIRVHTLFPFFYFWHINQSLCNISHIYRTWLDFYDFLCPCILKDVRLPEVTQFGAPRQALNYYENCKFDKAEGVFREARKSRLWRQENYQKA